MCCSKGIGSIRIRVILLTLHDVNENMSSSNLVHVHHSLGEQWKPIFVILQELLGRRPGYCRGESVPLRADIQPLHVDYLTTRVKSHDRNVIAQTTNAADVVAVKPFD